MDNMGTVRFKVGKILADKGIKVQDFASMAGLNYRTALAISKDKTNRIDKTTLAKVCDALHVTPSDVIDYIPD